MSNEAVILLCAVLALVIAAGSIVLAVLSRRNLKRVVRVLGVGVFLMLVVVIYPSFHLQGVSYAAGLALVQAMCAMLLNADAGEVLGAFDGYTVAWIGVYKALLLALLIVAPLFTVGITLSFFSEKFTRLVYRIRSAFAPSFLLSEVNERTLCAAEDIARKNRRAVIVFAVRSGKEGVDAASLDRIKAIGASVICEDIVNIAHSLRHERNYYLLGADGSANLDAGLRLYRKYSDRTTDRVNLWLYARGEIPEVIFDYLYETFNVRLINEESLIARRFVSDHPLYTAVREGRLSVLLVGGGRIGQEILRWATQCACLGDVETEFNVIDGDGERARAVFEKTAPGLAERQNIIFRTADISTAAFSETLRGIRPTYIAVALGDQTLNLETALYLRRFYGRIADMPLIFALIDRKNIEEEILPYLAISDWRYDGEKRTHVSTYLGSFDVQPFGSYEETYSDLRVGANYLDCLAVAVNAANCGITGMEGYTPSQLTDLYNQVMFYKNFSDGYAVSVQYKLYLMGLALRDDGEGDLTLLEERLEAHLTLLRDHENRRYEAFMRGNGWTDLPPGEVQGGRLGDKLTKRNARLDNLHVPELTALTGRNFREEDERSLRNLPAVIRLANALSGKRYSVREIEKK